jgi:hypothetical protein
MIMNPLSHTLEWPQQLVERSNLRPARSATSSPVKGAMPPEGRTVEVDICLHQRFALRSGGVVLKLLQAWKRMARARGGACLVKVGVRGALGWLAAADVQRSGRRRRPSVCRGVKEGGGWIWCVGLLVRRLVAQVKWALGTRARERIIRPTRWRNMARNLYP